MSRIIIPVFMVCRYRFREHIRNKRVFLSDMVLCVFLFLAEEGILEFSGETGIGVTLWIFPHLSGDWICQMMISGFFIWLVSALCAPQGNNLFVKGRAGSPAWNCGNCFAVLLFALIYTMGILVASTVFLLPCAEYSLEWGKGWYTLAFTNAGEIYRTALDVSPIILHTYAPIQAMLWSVLLEFLCLAWLGLLIYMVNFLTDKPVGLYCALTFIFLDMMLYNTGMEIFFRFSPVTLAQLGNYSAGTVKYGLSLRGAVIFYITGIVLFSGMSIILSRSKRRTWCSI